MPLMSISNARRRQPHVERGDQALPTGEQAGVACSPNSATASSSRARFLVGEWRRLHVSSPTFSSGIVTGNAAQVNALTSRGSAPPRISAVRLSQGERNGGEFEGKVVVVSGGSRGIGRAIAAAFAREGAQTVLAASNPATLAEGAKAVAAVGLEPLTAALSAAYRPP